MHAPVAPLAMPQHASLASFIATIEDVVAMETDPHVVTAAVQSQMAALLRDPSFLAPEFRQASSDGYRTHVIAAAPSRAFSVLSMVWLPGQTTPIHDHICWCVVGVLEGLEREQRFSLREDGRRTRWLAPLDEVTIAVGQTSALIPPDENIHQVRNAGTSTAISIHVYGADISVRGTSINQRFDATPIRADALSGRPVAWRPEARG